MRLCAFFLMVSCVGVNPDFECHRCNQPAPLTDLAPSDDLYTPDLRKYETCKVSGMMTCKQTIDNDEPDFANSCVPSLCICTDNTGCCCVR